MTYMEIQRPLTVSNERRNMRDFAIKAKEVNDLLHIKYGGVNDDIVFDEDADIENLTSAEISEIEHCVSSLQEILGYSW